jgi:Ca-activated chloride channel homolog
VILSKKLKSCNTNIALALLFTIFLLNLQTAHRPFISKAASGISKSDIVFVFDASRSMRHSDPGNIRYEAVRLFIDMSQVRGDRAALVAFAGGIEAEMPMRTLDSSEKKEAFKAELNNIGLMSYTDIGMGLKRAVEILNKEHDKKNNPIIILLSDGRNNPIRPKSLSDEDMRIALAEAKEKNYPIYTIGLNYDLTVDEEQLKDIAKQTNAVSFITREASDLVKILQDIFAYSSKLKLLQDQSVIGNGEFQEISIRIPDGNVAEANICILSSSKVDMVVVDPSGQERQADGNKLFISRSREYSLIKIIDPEEGDWNIKLKSDEGNRMQVSLIANYQLESSVTVKPESEIYIGTSISIEAYLMESSNKITDSEFYRSIEAKVKIENLSDNSVSTKELTYNGDILHTDLELYERGEYKVSVRFEGQGFYTESESYIIEVINRNPLVSEETTKIKLSQTGSSKIKNLSQYFRDEDGDELTYSIEVVSGNSVEASINGENLVVIPMSNGVTSIVVSAEDGHGGSTSKTIEVHVNSKLMQFISEMYVVLILIGVMIVCAVFLIINHIKIQKYK